MNIDTNSKHIIELNEINESEREREREREPERERELEGKRKRKRKRHKKRKSMEKENDKQEKKPKNILVEDMNIASLSSSSSTTTAESTSTSASASASASTSSSASKEKKNKKKQLKSKNLEEQKIKKMTKACKTILECVGENPSREGLLKTPERWAKALLFLTHGYNKTICQETNDAIFEENHKEMVLVRDIDIHSLCEHHMLPFTGRLHVGYIPNGKIIGLSKIARLAEVFARRLQVQERLTQQIADAMVEAVSPLGVAVVIESSHFCMVMRGVQKTGSSTVTSCVRGCFESNSKTRAEFFSIINRK